MKSKINILIAGGDMRQIFCADKLSEKYNVSTTGFNSDLIHEISLKNDFFDCLVLPVPPFDEKGNINTPCFEDEMSLNDLSKYLKKDCLIFTGRSDKPVSYTHLHWLEMGEKLGDKAPKIFNVNWFKQDENGNFIWPGFGDNMRVLDWIIKRCEGTVDAEETAIGYIPKKGDINVVGIEDEVTPEIMDKLLNVDTDLWKQEIAEMRRYYNDDIAAKGGKIPAALYEELDKLESRLNG